MTEAMDDPVATVVELVADRDGVVSSGFVHCRVFKTVKVDIVFGGSSGVGGTGHGKWQGRVQQDRTERHTGLVELSEAIGGGRGPTRCVVPVQGALKFYEGI
jgi:hypothetical protein